MFLNSTVNLDNVATLAATLATSGTYTLWANGQGIQSGDSRGLPVGGFTSQAALQSAISALIADLGEPWQAIGDLSNVAQLQDPKVIAVNLRNVVQFGDGVTGVSFNDGWITAGYAPYANSATALSGILAAVGSITFP